MYLLIRSRAHECLAEVRSSSHANLRVIPRKTAKALLRDWAMHPSKSPGPPHSLSALFEDNRGIFSWKGTQTLKADCKCKCFSREQNPPICLEDQCDCQCLFIVFSFTCVLCVRLCAWRMLAFVCTPCKKSHSHGGYEMLIFTELWWHLIALSLGWDTLKDFFKPRLILKWWETSEMKVCSTTLNSWSDQRELSRT